ncbi:Glucose receptor Git3 N-terminal domain-containing protein [Madurella fahalii]|uniref:Glucose receptor Git3 N-terminal domain-containing protein n=1 Tax=Madurella fahalii TaxID=1157608 RepID=A0ABQ0G7J7_9PEZI
MLGTPNCSVIPDAVPSDAGIAGAGVLLSSAITAGLALGISASLVLQDLWRSASPNRNPSVIRRKLLNSYSDQQIMVGIGLQGVGLAKSNSLIPYHFFLVWMMALLSTATHNGALLALVRDFKRDPVLRWLRQFLMFVNLALSCVYGVHVLVSKIKDLPDTLPIGCVWALESTTSNVGGIDYFGTIVVIAGNLIVFGLATWYLQSRRQRAYYKAVQLIGLVLMSGIAIGATVRAYLLSQAFGNPDVNLSDNGEKEWSFGQLLSMLMLILPVISAIEIMRGEISVAPLVPHDVDDDKQALFAGKDVQ